MKKILYPLLCASALVLTACNQQTNNTADNKAVNKATEQAQNAAQFQAKAKNLVPYQQRDVRDEVFYFVLPDRFYNQDPSNDQGDPATPASFGGFKPEDKGYYHGGDLQGLIAKLPYLDNLGVSAIWLTPIFRNQAVQGDSAGYHGYWILDFKHIDPHLGSNDDLKQLIAEAHDRNIKIYFDIIVNHTADVIKYRECDAKNAKLKPGDDFSCPYKSLEQIKQGDSYTAYVPEDKAHLKYPEWLNDKKYYHNQGDTTFVGENSIYGDFAGLDDIDTDNPEVVANMTELFKELVTEFKPDGFRIDTVKHVNIEFWQQFSPAIMAHAKSLGIDNFFMFGEVYSFEPKTLSYFTNEGKLPSVLDFSLQGVLNQTLVEQQGTDKFAELFKQDNSYTNPDFGSDYLVTFTGNHDMGRFAHFLAKSPFNYSQQQQLERVNLANALLFMLRGIPVIYYGDEQGFIGDGGDKDSRQDMMPSQVASYNDDKLLGTNKTTADDNFDINHPLYQSLSRLAAFFHQHDGLKRGKQSVIYSQATPGLFAFSRSLSETEDYLILVNTSDQAIDYQKVDTTGYQPIFNLQSDKEATKDAIAGVNLIVFKKE